MPNRVSRRRRSNLMKNCFIRSPIAAMRVIVVVEGGYCSREGFARSYRVDRGFTRLASGIATVFTVERKRVVAV